MIQIEFFSKGEELDGFASTGHSYLGEEGEDIVCAAVSSATIMAANTLTEIIGAQARVEAEDGYLFIRLLNKLSESQAVLRGLELHLNALAQDYPDYIKLLQNDGGATND